MTPLETGILDALCELEAAAAALRAGGPRPDLRPILDRLSRFAGELPPGTHPDLLHYMRRQSYEKARLFLLGRTSEVPPGACGH
jgi:hypothetical protein